MIIKIVCAGVNTFENLYQPDREEFLVGVDGGVESIIHIGKNIDLALGDFDSCNIEDVVKYCNDIKVFPKEKDYGDLELAIMEVINKPFDKIVIYNATGGRMDHFYAVINVLIKYSKYNIEVIDDNNLIRIISNNTIIPSTQYKYCSIFAIEDNTIISLDGFKYNLSDYHLNRFDNLCLSNEVIFEGKITVNDKKLLIIETL